MNRRLQKYELDTDLALNYFINVLESGNTLSGSILSSKILRKGDFYTLLPADINVERLNEFSYGGIIPSVKLEDNKGLQIQTTFGETTNFIQNFFADSTDNYAIFEDVISKPLDPSLDKIHSRVLGDEVYYFLKRKNVAYDEVATVFRNAHQVWHTLCVLYTDTTEASQTQLSKQYFKNVCKKINYIIIGAYDGEGYIFWEPKQTL